MEPVECRYAENAGRYWFTAYGPCAVDDHEAAVPERPDWLTNIVTIATVGEYFLMVSDPPPERVLWFSIDENCSLVKFVVHQDR